MSITLEEMERETAAMKAVENEMLFQRRHALEHAQYEPFSIGEEILRMEELLAMARRQYLANRAPTAALHEIRKVAAMATRTLANHGIVERAGYERDE